MDDNVTVLLRDDDISINDIDLRADLDKLKYSSKLEDETFFIFILFGHRTTIKWVF